MAIENTAIANSDNNEIPLNLPNNQLVDNKFDDLVDQKVNYLFGNPMEVKTDDEGLIDLLGKKFHRQLLNVAKDAYIGGKGTYILTLIVKMNWHLNASSQRMSYRIGEMKNITN